MSQETSLRWFLIFTKPSREETAKIHLERQGYCVYHPRLLRPLRQRGRWMERVVSLFPRYLFVRVDTARQALGPARSTVGVADIVRFGFETAVVPDAIVDGLMRRADPQSGLHRLSTVTRPRRGSAVRIVAGVFDGLDGIFERETGDDRVVVLLNLLGRQTPVRVRADFLQLAG